MKSLVFRGLLCLIFSTPCPVLAQEEDAFTEKQLREDFDRAYAAMIRGNIHGWGDFYDGEIPEQFRKISDFQRAMLQWEPLAPGVPTTEILLEALDLQPGDTLVDFGCGMAHEEAMLLTYGMDHVTVYGLDIDTFALEVAPRLMRWTLAFIDYYNASMNVLDTSLAQAMKRPEAFEFIPVLVEEGNPGLDAECTDRLMCIRTLHHLDASEIEGMVSLVRPGGRICILDHVASKASKSKCRDGEVAFYLTDGEIVERMESAGCTLLSSEHPHPHAGVYVFQRD